METFLIPDWTSGTYTLNLPASAKCVEVYDNNGKLLSDNYNVTLTSYGQLKLDYENYAGSAWPLRVVVFDPSSSSTSTEALFNQPFGAPYYISRFGIGKRHETAKNVNFRELCKFINDDGGICITKDFTGFDPEIARTNLDVYSTGEINAIAENIIGQSRGEFTHTTTVPATPYCLNSQGNQAMATVTTTYVGGVCKIHVEIDTNGMNTRKSGFQRMGDILAAIMGIEDLLPQQMIIAYPKYAGEYGWPLNAYRYTGSSNHGAWDITSVLEFPPLILSKAPTLFCGTLIPATSLGFMCVWPSGTSTEWRKFSGIVRLRYDLEFYPPQQ